MPHSSHFLFPWMQRWGLEMQQPSSHHETINLGQRSILHRWKDRVERQNLDPHWYNRDIVPPPLLVVWHKWALIWWSCQWLGFLLLAAECDDVWYTSRHCSSPFMGQFRSFPQSRTITLFIVLAHRSYFSQSQPLFNSAWFCLMSVSLLVCSNS